jgi:hypothetical protein
MITVNDGVQGALRGARPNRRASDTTNNGYST